MSNKIGGLMFEEYPDRYIHAKPLIDEYNVASIAKPDACIYITTILCVTSVQQSSVTNNMGCKRSTKMLRQSTFDLLSSKLFEAYAMSCSD